MGNCLASEDVVANGGPSKMVQEGGDEGDFNNDNMRRSSHINKKTGEAEIYDPADQDKPENFFFEIDEDAALTED